MHNDPRSLQWLYVQRLQRNKFYKTEEFDIYRRRVVSELDWNHAGEKNALNVRRKQMTRGNKLRRPVEFYF